MRNLLAAALFALAGTAGAQTAAPSPAQPPVRPSPAGDSGLNLKLDEPAKPRPRITFGPAVPAMEQGPGSAASSLPSLGGTPGIRPGPSIDVPVKNPYPANTNPMY